MTEETAAHAPPRALTITLRKPVTLGDTYTKLDLAEPVVGQMILWSDRVGVERDICAVSTVAAIPEGAVRQIGARDFLAAARFVHSFELVGNAEEHPSDEKTITLREPIEWAGTTYSTVALREPLASELIEWDRSTGIVGDCAMVAAIAGIPDHAVRRMQAGEFMEAAAYLSGFSTLPAGWGSVLDALAARYGQTPAAIAKHRWSDLRQWCAWSGIQLTEKGAEG